VRVEQLTAGPISVKTRCASPCGSLASRVHSTTRRRVRAEPSRGARRTAATVTATDTVLVEPRRGAVGDLGRDIRLAARCGFSIPCSRGCSPPAFARRSPTCGASWTNSRADRPPPPDGDRDLRRRRRRHRRLRAAEVLRGRGVTVIVFEKSRGVGGRLATRRIGALPMRPVSATTAHSFSPPAAVSSGRASRVAGAGSSTPGTPKTTSATCVGGMTAPAKALASGLESTWPRGRRPRGGAIGAGRSRARTGASSPLTRSCSRHRCRRRWPYSTPGAACSPPRCGRCSPRWPTIRAWRARSARGPSRVPPPGALEAGALDRGFSGSPTITRRVCRRLPSLSRCTRRRVQPPSLDAANDAVAGELLVAAGEWVGAAVVTARSTAGATRARRPCTARRGSAASVSAARLRGRRLCRRTR